MSYERSSLVCIACEGRVSASVDIASDENDSASMSTACERDDFSNVGAGITEYG